MEKIKTHRLIDENLSGKAFELSENFAKVALKTTKNMVVDDRGLIHGGFIFSGADYTAMLAVNHPYVVLAGANVKFLKPVRLGDTVIFEGKVIEDKGKKKIVKVEGTVAGEKVFEGEFYCVVLEKHVLD